MLYKLSENLEMTLYAGNLPQGVYKNDYKQMMSSDR